jgi:hypothetical protein
MDDIILNFEHISEIFDANVMHYIGGRLELGANPIRNFKPDQTDRTGSG